MARTRAWKATVAAAVVMAIAACSSQPPGATGPVGGGQTEAPGGATPGGGQTGDSGATIRLVNVWAEPTALGPSVELRVRRGATLLTATPGQVTDFVPVPKAEFGDGAASLQVVKAGAPVDENGIGVTQVNAGDKVTVIVHGEVSGGAINMRIEPIWEVGEAGVGVPFPTVEPTQAVLAVFAGPLLALSQEEGSIWVRTDKGECLISTLFGSPEEGGFGGTGATYFALPTGSVTIDVASQGTSGCTKLDPDIGSVTFNTVTGQRVGLIVWGKSGDLQLLQLDFGTG
jgi:hypothetical protein